jgi:hypothetical protein
LLFFQCRWFGFLSPPETYCKIDNWANKGGQGDETPQGFFTHASEFFSGNVQNGAECEKKKDNSDADNDYCKGVHVFPIFPVSPIDLRWSEWC